MFHIVHRHTLTARPVRVSCYAGMSGRKDAHLPSSSSSSPPPPSCYIFVLSFSCTFGPKSWFVFTNKHGCTMLMVLLMVLLLDLLFWSRGGKCTTLRLVFYRKGMNDYRRVGFKLSCDNMLSSRHYQCLLYYRDDHLCLRILSRGTLLTAAPDVVVL